ncbi:MAG: hypothetical protein ACKVQK_25300 [Burkholderiales bacterium]
MALSVKEIEHARPGNYIDSNRLCLQVSRGGSKSWIFRFQLESDAGKSLAEKDAVDLLVGTPDELGRLLRDDITYWTDVLREVEVER